MPAPYQPSFPPPGNPFIQTGPWQPYEKEFLRVLTGVPLLYTNFDPKFESAILTVQTVADGGSLPDNSVQQNMRANMLNVANIDNNLMNGANFGMAVAVDHKDIVVNFALHRHINKQEGRRLVMAVLAQLGLKSPFRDYFTGAQLLSDWQDMFVMYV